MMHSIHFRFCLARFWFLLIAVTVCLASGAALSTAHAHNRFESSTILIKPFAEAASYGFELKNELNQRPIKWQPNTRSTTGGEIFINGLFGVGLAGRGILSNEDRVNKGETDYQDFRFSFAYPSFNVGVTYNRFRGFYIENTTDVDPSLDPTGPRIQAAELSVSNLAANLTWIFAPDNFSLEAALDQTVRQEASGGSWLAGIAYSEAIFSNSTSLIPASERANYGVDQNVNSARFRALLLRGGYGYTAVVKQKWFGTLTGLIGVGPQMGRYSDGVTNKDNNRTIQNVDISATVGYNGETFVSGIRLAAETTGFQTESIRINSNLFSLKLHVGMRF